MTVFVTGATGVLGRPVVSGLVRQGYTVSALSRSPANRQLLQELGAQPVEIGLCSPAALAEVLCECDTVLHLATRIPTAGDMKKPGVWNENDRLRRRGTRSLVAAAEMAGTITTMLYPSISLFYGDGGDTWLTAANATCEPASVHQSTLDAENSVRSFTRDHPDRRGIVLRFATFYGPESPDSLQVFELARRGLFMPIADASAYKSMLWIDDAATAVLKAVESAPSGIYDIAEDTPKRQDEAATALAAAVGRRKLHKPPRWLLRLAVPAELREVLARSQRISNDRFKQVTGWRPSVPSQADGWRLFARASEQAFHAEAA